MFSSERLPVDMMMMTRKYFYNRPLDTIWTRIFYFIIIGLYFHTCSTIADYVVSRFSKIGVTRLKIRVGNKKKTRYL